MYGSGWLEELTQQGSFKCVRAEEEGNDKQHSQQLPGSFVSQVRS